MADTVTLRTVLNGTKDYIVYAHCVSDGTGNSEAVLVDKSALAAIGGAEPTAIDIVSIQYVTMGVVVKLEWKHTSNVPIAYFGHAADSTYGKLCFEPQELRDSGSGSTGDIVSTTVGHTSGDFYDIVIHCKLRP